MPALQMCLAGLIKGYPQQADLLRLTPMDDENTSPAAQHTSGDGDPGTDNLSESWSCKAQLPAAPHILG